MMDEEKADRCRVGTDRWLSHARNCPRSIAWPEPSSLRAFPLEVSALPCLMAEVYSLPDCLGANPLLLMLLDLRFSSFVTDSLASR